MSQSDYSQIATAQPIRALIIQPDDSYKVRVIQQATYTFRRLVGGHFDSVSTEHCTFFCNQHGQRAGLPHGNRMATYLWWQTQPEVEDRAMLRGSVFVTGLADEHGHSLPVSDEMVALYERMEQILTEEEDA